MYILFIVDKKGNIESEGDIDACSTLSEVEDLVNYYCDPKWEFLKRNEFRYIKVNKKDMRKI